MNFIKKSGALVLLTSLAACIEGTDQIDTISAEEFGALITRTNDASAADPEDLVGEATMSGGIVFLVDSEQEEFSVTMGNMNMVADFTNSEISGAATELEVYNTSGECLSIETCDMELLASFDGELVLDGVIDGPNFTGMLNGELTASQEVTEGEETFMVTGVADVNLDVDGGFGVDDAGLMAYADLNGDVSVDYSVDGELEETSVDTFTGLFIVAE